MSKTILVVEDNEMNMKIFCDVLESRGYKTVRAYSGMAGLQFARSRNPDLIILDIQLPDISGMDVSREIKADRLLNHIPIVAVTAFSMKDDKEKILAAGCDAYMAKPIMIPEFLSMIDKMLSTIATELKSTEQHGEENSDPKR